MLEEIQRSKMDVVASDVRAGGTWILIRSIIIGVLCGVVWATGFRAYMAGLVGPSSQFQWWGTFGAIIAPGALAGGLLGWAEYIRGRGGRPGWRWLALSTVPLAIAPMLMPGALVALLTEGLGGGAIGIVLLAIAGGYALCGRGRVWTRSLSGLLSATILAGVVAAVPGIGGPRMALTEPRGAWVALLGASFAVALALANSIPFRAVR